MRPLKRVVLGLGPGDLSVSVFQTGKAIVEKKLRGRAHPRPMNGIWVAITVMN
jgi:hypothetical protein